MRCLRVLFALCVAVLLSVDAAEAERVTVFAAASLKNALDEIAESFAAATDHTAVVSLAGSAALARQIQRGAPADLFISANEAWMDVLAEDQLIAPETRRDLLSNTLVLIAHDPGAAPLDPIDARALNARLGTGRIAMALVEATPAGIYAKAALSHIGAWESLRPKAAQTDSVRAALALVARGEAPLGIVYATDVRAEPRVRLIGVFPAESHPPIVYPVAAIGPDVSPATQAFLAHLSSDGARAAFEAHGFIVLGS